MHHIQHHFVKMDQKGYLDNMDKASGLWELPESRSVSGLRQRRRVWFTHSRRTSGNQEHRPVPRKRDRSDTLVTVPGTWPQWARVTMSCVVIFHLVAVVSGGLAVPPSSVVERSIADVFTWYYGLVDVGYAYRFYVEPPPTPVVTATLQFGDGRPDETVRLPGRNVPGPRMRHQRQLALANALFMDVEQARQRTGEASRSLLSRAFARHLCKTRAGCQAVTIHLQHHLIPEMEEVRQAIESTGTGRFDLFSETLFSAPERIGVYPCDGF
jgi:hypothetical protein